MTGICGIFGIGIEVRGTMEYTGSCVDLGEGSIGTIGDTDHGGVIGEGVRSGGTPDDTLSSGILGEENRLGGTVRYAHSG